MLEKHDTQENLSFDNLLGKELSIEAGHGLKLEDINLEELDLVRDGDALILYSSDGTKQLTINDYFEGVSLGQKPPTLTIGDSVISSENFDQFESIYLVLKQGDESQRVLLSPDKDFSYNIVDAVPVSIDPLIQDQSLTYSFTSSGKSLKIKFDGDHDFILQDFYDETIPPLFIEGKLVDSDMLLALLNMPEALKLALLAGSDPSILNPTAEGDDSDPTKKDIKIKTPEKSEKDEGVDDDSPADEKFPPDAQPETATGTENQTLTINVLANDTDGRGTEFHTLREIENISGKGQALIKNNLLEFNPLADFDHLNVGDTEQVQIAYVMANEDGMSSDSVLTITYTGTNDGPVANPDVSAGHENESLLIDVLANDTDVDDNASFTILSVAASNGTAILEDNQLRFEPGTDFDHLEQGVTETVSVTYTMRDEHGAESTSTATIIVTGTNDGPVANPDASAGHENESLLIDVLANDTDVEGDVGFTLLLVEASKGVATIEANQLRFEPGTDFDHLEKGAEEIVTVTYTMRGEHGAESSSTATITVTGTNDTPVTVIDTYDSEGIVGSQLSLTENEGSIIDVLANDSDVDDNAQLTIDWGTFFSYGIDPKTGQNAQILFRMPVINDDGQEKLFFDPGTYFDYLSSGQTVVLGGNYAIRDEHGATKFGQMAMQITGVDEQGALIKALANDNDVNDNAIDALVGSDGNDYIDVGVIQTTVHGNGGDDVILATGSTTDNTFYGDAGDDELFGGSGDDSLFGGDDDDRLEGNSGNDILSGGDGSDMVFGGAGEDTLYLGAGFDTVDAGTGEDTFFFEPGVDAQHVDTLLVGYEQGEQINVDSLFDGLGVADNTEARNDLILFTEYNTGTTSGTEITITNVVGAESFSLRVQNASSDSFLNPDSSVDNTVLITNEVPSIT